MSQRPGSPDFNKASHREGRGIDSPLDDVGRTALHLSVRKGDADSVAKLLRLHANPQQADERGQTPLYEAITRQDIAMAGLLLDHGGTFRTEDKAGRTPVMWAVEQECGIEFLEQLRGLGMVLDFQSDAGQKALHSAATNNLPEMVDYLVKKGAELDFSDMQGRTALHLAAENKSHAAMEKLLSLGADPVLRTNELKTALHIVIEAGDIAGADILLTQPSVKQTINDFQTYGDGFTPLMTAVQGNRLAIAEKLIGIGADLNQRDNKNRHSLFIAVEGGHPEMVELLIRHGADVAKGLQTTSGKTPMIHKIDRDCYAEMLLILYAAGANLDAVDSSGQSVLHIAANIADQDGVRMLLSLGANPNLANDFGQRPIDVAMEQSCYSDVSGIVRLLLNHRADPNLSPFADTPYAPLHVAARYGHVEIAKMLLASNAVVDERDRGQEGMTPFMIAIEHGYHEVAETLLKAGADPLKKDKLSRNALHLAAQQSSRKIIENLLSITELAAKTDEKDREGLTPLHYACRMQRPACAEALIRAGASPLVPDPQGMTALHYAAAGDHEALVTIFENAPGAKINWNIANRDGETLLHLAVRRGHQAMTERLLKLGADDTIKSGQGLPALHLALVTDQSSTFQALVNHIKSKKLNPDDYRDGNGWTALHTAATRFAFSNMAALLEAGADINARTPEGNTPLHVAVQLGYGSVVNYLLTKGADMGVLNSEGRTPLDIAVEQKKQDMVSALLAAVQAQKPKPIIQQPIKHLPPPNP